jgi:Serine dehydrogenase proteinase
MIPIGTAVPSRYPPIDKLAESFQPEHGRTTFRSAATAKELRLPISTEMPNDVLELMKLYPQPIRAQRGGGVEYLPIPWQKEAVSRET